MNIEKKSIVVRRLFLILLSVVLASASAMASVRSHLSSDSLFVPPPQIVDLMEDVEQRVTRNEGWWEANQTHSTRFRPTQLIAPAALITVGALGVGENAPLRGVSVTVNDQFYEWSGGRKYHFDDYIQYLPVALYLTFDFMGVRAKHSFGERVAVAAVTYLSVAAFSQGVKYTVREPRPFSGTRNSFPSGHTTTAFAGAELVRSEYGWGAGLAAYAMATTVGVMRMYNGRHWLNDVIAGAGFGILSARIGYWMLPLSRHIFKIPRKGQALIATPIYDTHSRALGLSCAMQF